MIVIRKTRFFITLILFAAIAAMSSNCATFHGIPASTSADRVLHLKPKRGIKIISVDGTILGTFRGFFGSSVYVSPGKHTLSAEFDQIFFRSMGQASINVRGSAGETIYVCPRVDYFAKKWQPFASSNKSCE